MAISTVTNDTSAAAAYMKKTTGLNKDDFMKLFITQLQNQDPMNPTDSTQMVAQMAQLTQVEQAYNANTNLTNLLTAQSNLTAVSYIGKTITAQGSDIQLASGSASQVNYNLGSAADSVKVTIKNSAGSTVRVLTGGSAATGNGSMTWDGLDSTGAQAASGAYTFSVTGVNSYGSTFDGTSLVKRAVTGVTMNQGSPVLQSAGGNVPLANVIGVGG